ncbi:hypothetical protein SERLADRAFT_441458 [Serpula lacrymans var. lacrymans S7.9]|uniref:Uncharacterized protein n=1 Tax=Serpula lacrymans var. lacrymans (strain S7.9) TaxID=578457 RepID=F8P6K5_SERL9|nr:uncharacterized protein SERLADRAFT_441458 [Serpula lacrymans var. lacrymans S7.9]EGO21071.1 hypothetical protein SERLADRAFT_441458 [Serpula lacrymans var. lacrymans S7.9]
MGTPLHTDDPLAALLPTSRFLMSSHSIDDISDNDNQSQQLSGEGHSIARTLTSCKTGSVQTLASQGNPPALSRITWSNKRTDRIMDWLEKHPVRHQMLFSDSLSVARGENRPVVRNTKSVRVPIVRRIARHVFKNDSKEEFCIAVDHHRKQFGESVQSRLDHLGEKYKECVCSLSGTGAGLPAEELASSGFSNPIASYLLPDSTRPSEADQMEDFMQPIIQSAKEQEAAALEVKRLKLVHGSDVIRYKSLKVQSKIDETKKQEQIEIAKLQMENDAKNDMEMRKFELLACLGVFGNQGGNQQLNMSRGLLGSSVNLPSPPEFAPSQTADISGVAPSSPSGLTDMQSLLQTLTPSADMNYDDADMSSQYASTSSGHHHHPSTQTPSIFQGDYHSGDTIYDENNVIA